MREATENVARVEALNTESGQRGNSWSLPVDADKHAKTPVWSGRTQWQQQVRASLNSPTGTALCTKNDVGSESVFAVAVMHAALAEGRTGRGVTASRKTIAQRAGVSISVVKRARSVLKALGMAVEHARGRYLTTLESMAAESHHGRRQYRAASVWSLTSPRAAVQAVTAPVKKAAKATRAALRSAAYRARTAAQSYPQSATRDPLSPSGGFALKALVLNYSPTHAQARAGKPKNAQRSTPRPITVQRAAAQLIAHTPALKAAGHVGRICDVLEKTDIDVTRWTGRDIARELTKDTQTRGWVWPTSLTHPVAFLSWRLAQIDWSGVTPAERARENDRMRLAEQARRRQEAAERSSRAASAATRAAIVRRSRAQFSRTAV
ncbi:replication protein [Rhodococcus erythropolis]|uniref:replication protein n=1 Tax=Rhodococcus erythropolis TaxID=1833 RepID=UPI0037B984C6